MFGKIAVRIFPGIAHLPEFILLFSDSLGCLPRSLPYALAGAHPDEVCLEFGEGGDDVEEHPGRRISGIMI